MAHGQKQPRQHSVHYLFLTLASVHAVAAATQILGDSDPAVQYTPPDLGSNLCAATSGDTPDCAGKWYEEPIPGAYKGFVRSTAGPGTSLLLTFRGSAIIVKGVTDRRAARALVTLDGGTVTSIDTGSQQRFVGQILFQATGLNEKVEHRLNITYDPASLGHRSPRVLRIDSFEISSGEDGRATIGSAPLPIPTTDQPSPSYSSNHDDPFSSAVPTSSTSVQTPPIIGTASSSRSSSTVPIVAGLGTGLATLVIASVFIFFMLRRRRAIRVQSVELPRTSPSAIRKPQIRGLASLAYVFNRRGSSVTSSADGPSQQPLQTRRSPPPVPQINTYVSPYSYQRPGPAYPRSEDQTSVGLPVDERPPNIPRSPISPAVLSPRVLRVYNPDGSTVVSSNHS